MKYTKEYLLEAAQNFVNKKIARDPAISAVLLIGSLRKIDHFIDRPMDVDLLVLRDEKGDVDNELVRISDEHHLDVHYDDALAYDDPKMLRSDSVRGWALWDASVLYQREHFFEFTQSTVRSQFDEPRNVIDRMRYYIKPARELWLENSATPENVDMETYLSAIFAAGNALACIDREPLSIRSFLTDLFDVTKNLEIEDINSRFMNCLSSDLSIDLIQSNFALWEELFMEGCKYPADDVITPLRLAYFRSSIDSELAGTQPIRALWPFLFTISKMPIRFSEFTELIQKHADVKTAFGFSPNGMGDKFKYLDLLLEDIEGIIEQLLVDYAVE